MLNQYSKQQVIDLIKKILDDADKDIWRQVKALPEERSRLLAAADALEIVTDAFYREISEL